MFMRTCHNMQDQQIRGRRKSEKMRRRGGNEECEGKYNRIRQQGGIPERLSEETEV